ncbi:unnamed protein product, partial [Rhizoctonia solani]
MESSAPPVYSSSLASGDEAPPAFEPGSSAPVAPIDTKPLDQHSAVGAPVPPPPTRIRAPEDPNFESKPPTLAINGKITGPFDLITVQEVKTHLVFLGAFARLKAEVKSQKGVDVRGSTDELWAVYLARAVDRFAAWVSKGLPIDLDASNARLLNEYEVPPLDVLMAWHAYLLNPRVHYEDGVTKKSQLLGISPFPLNHLEKIIDIDTLVALHPSPERQQRFESLTGQSWLCPLNTTIADTAFIPCPRCEKSTLTEVCWITNENTGFAQHDFKARCHACMGVFNRDAMMVRGLCDDIVKVRVGLTHKSSNPEQKPYISGTLLDWKTGQPNAKEAARSNDILLKHFFTPASMKFTRGDWLAGSINYSIKRLETALKDGLSLKGGFQVTRILSYYRCPYYPFSIELCGAVLRQGAFIDRMFGLGWTEPRTFDQDPTVLHRCLARYHAWLDVMSQLNRKMLVPTLDIDLVWHTHQLKQQDYRTWTLEVLGQFIDHDDKIEENKLSEAYEQTAKYWEVSAPPPYYFNLKSIPDHSNDGGSPTMSAAAHVYAKWDKQLRVEVDKGRVPPDGWEAMNIQRAAEHEQGFMRPMPDPNLAPVIPYGAETCAAHNGGVLNGENLASSPVDGKHSAGICAAGMGLYSMAPMGGFYIGPMGVCAGASNGGCGGGGGLTGGACGGAVSTCHSIIQTNFRL